LFFKIVLKVFGRMSNLTATSFFRLISHRNTLRFFFGSVSPYLCDHKIKNYMFIWLDFMAIKTSHLL
jgi:hypothetical protein